ncbi:hypothetical protein BN938_0781 [Mucinivorans hirudinis]|uniref:Uncharacterized protein n=1 Tax=Mucinivorans hirudinis TaxID=1433126 RepID=A0A060R6Z6_9BACT|nr:hypothetical protein BN938_0781 [Mucinivorans hirudinis]
MYLDIIALSLQCKTLVFRYFYVTSYVGFAVFANKYYLTNSVLR